MKGLIDYINEANQYKSCKLFGVNKINNIKELSDAFIKFGKALAENENNIKQIQISQNYDANKVTLWIRDYNLKDVFKTTVEVSGLQM